MKQPHLLKFTSQGNIRAILALLKYQRKQLGITTKAPFKKTFWVRQIIIWIVVVTISLGFAGEAQAADKELYKQMTGRDKFAEIQKQVTHSSLNISNYKASDAYKDIANALNIFRQLHTQVQKATHVDDVIEEVADGLDRIATTYQKVAGFSTEMTQYRKGEFSYLQDVNGNTLKTQLELKEQIAKLESENKILQRKRNSVTDEIESKKFEISIQGNEYIINSLEAQCIIWEKFYLAQKKLLESLELNGRKVDLLLHLLQVNANVYHEAANVARLRRSAKGALDNLRSLADIQGIVSDLQDSWLQINDLVSKISEAEFVIDIK